MAQRVRKADKLPPSCTVVTKSGHLNFLEPSGPLQVSNGTAFYLQWALCVCVCVVDCVSSSECFRFLWSFFYFFLILVSKIGFLVTAWF